MQAAGGPSVVIVGAGHGIRVHLPALRVAGFDVVGLVGRDLDRTSAAARAAQIPRAFTDVGTAILQTGAKAVTIASPPLTHGEVVLQAIACGCHVLCEKPFAKDSREAEMLLEAAENAGIVHLIGNQMRASPEKMVVDQVIAAGLIGEARFATFVQHVNLVASPEAVRPEWWFNAQAGGGWLGASGSHLIDQIRNWLGDFHSISAATSILSDRRDVAEDSFDLRFKMVNGVEGVISQTGASWGPTVLMSRVMGSEGTLWIEGNEAWIADAQGSRPLPIPADLQLTDIAPSDDPRKRYLHVELPPTIKMCEAWRHAIESGTPMQQYATFADGLACMRVIDAIRESAATGGTLVEVR